MSRHDYVKQAAQEFAQRIVAMGFTVYLADRGTHGIITDDAESRVMSFQFDGVRSTLGGEYGPPSTTSGTGWQLSVDPCDLLTANDVRKALYAVPPEWAGSGWKYFTTLAQHLATYDASSRYTRVQVAA